MLWAGASAARLFSAFGDQIRWGRMGLGGPRGQTRGSQAVDVVEDLADQVRIGDIRYDPRLSAAERAAGDVYVEDALQSLPGLVQLRRAWVSSGRRRRGSGTGRPREIDAWARYEGGKALEPVALMGLAGDRAVQGKAVLIDCERFG
jgi:hypothetical protein